MGDHDRRTPLHQMLQRLLHQPLRLRVQSGGRLVEDQDRRVLQDGPGDADALPLSAGELAAPIADVGLIALLARLNEGMGVGDACRLLHLLTGSPLHAERNILIEGIIEKDRLLVDVAHQPAQIAEACLPHIHAINQDLPLRHVVEAGQQIDQRALARSRLPHQCHRLAFRDRQVDIFQHPLILILEPDIPIGDRLPQGDRLRLLRIEDRPLRLQDLIHTLHRGQPLLDGIDRLAQILGGVDDAIKNHQVIDKGRRVNRAVGTQDQGAAIPQHDRDCGCSQELTHRMRQLLAAINPVGQPAKRLVAPLKPLLNLPLRVKRLDDAQAAQGLLDLAHQEAPLLLPL